MVNVLEGSKELNTSKLNQPKDFEKALKREFFEYLLKEADKNNLIDGNIKNKIIKNL